MNADFVRLIDSIHREKGIDTEDLFLAFEEALITTIRKKHDVDEDFTLTFDRVTGEVQSEYEIDFEELGRIFAQTVKQTFYTKIKEAERDVLFNEYEEELETVITGQIQRFEGENVIVSLGKVDGVIPRSEKVRGESYHPGERIRALIHEVKKVGLRVKIILSRASNKLVQRLFELEVPEIADGVIEVRKLEREPGYRTKIAVSSSDARVDCVGACVGVRGTRIKAIIDELNGERIDIIRWSEDPETMLRNALQPAEVVQVTLDDRHAPRAGPRRRGSALAGDRPQGAERPPRVQADRLGHRHHDAQGARGDAHARRAGRGQHAGLRGAHSSPDRAGLDVRGALLRDRRRPHRADPRIRARRQ